jgi:hypothetical protein
MEEICVSPSVYPGEEIIRVEGLPPFRVVSSISAYCRWEANVDPDAPPEGWEECVVVERVASDSGPAVADICGNVYLLPDMRREGAGSGGRICKEADAAEREFEKI